MDSWMFWLAPFHRLLKIARFWQLEISYVATALLCPLRSPLESRTLTVLVAMRLSRMLYVRTLVGFEESCRVLGDEIVATVGWIFWDRSACVNSHREYYTLSH